MKKISLITCLLAILSIIIFSLVSYANTTGKIEIITDKTEYYNGNEVVVEVNLLDFEKNSGIICAGGVLEYDKDYLEFVKIEGSGEWEKPEFNELNGKWVTDRSEPMNSAETIFRVTFKVKLNDNQKTEIKLTNVEVSEGKGKITLNDASKELTIKKMTSVTTEKVEIITDKNEYYNGNQVIAEVKLPDFEKDSEIICAGGILEYDRDYLEFVKIEGTGEWGKPTFNELNGKWITDRSDKMSSGEIIFRVTFKVKLENENDNQKTEIRLTNVEVSGGKGTITLNDANKELLISKTKIYIESDIYDINKENNLILEISANTDITKFLSNIRTNSSELTFLDKDGNIVANIRTNTTSKPSNTSSSNTISDDSRLVKTGMKLRVGNAYEFALVVKGDADGDGKISINDLSLMKLHYVERTEYNLTGLYFKAADVDRDNRITVNDIAQVKLLYVKIK